MFFFPFFTQSFLSLDFGTALCMNMDDECARDTVVVIVVVKLFSRA